MNFRDMRYTFTHKLARLLIEGLPKHGSDHVLYAVQLSGVHSKPVYFGSSAEGLRRLWDLPIGESHHLANTYPPEIWRRVQVLQWKHVLSEQGRDINAITRDIMNRFNTTPKESVKLLGLGIEFLFQKYIQPEINVQTRRRVGGFKAVNYEKSTSKQAVIARDFLGPVFPDLLDKWQKLWLDSEATIEDVYVSASIPGRVVFPGRVFASLFEIVDSQASHRIL